MIDIDSYVRHKRTDKFGKVLGYGYKIIDKDYFTTLKVELLEEGAIKGFTEDVYTEWIPCKAELVYSSNSHN
ncbi:MAG: hypothetical protein QNJ41_19435 [Xenococcaceae cyanobacterium MO_188.B32]|nr:hypothetical protein [Xenococcaceae cyanobacterium MO_188.B32]